MQQAQLENAFINVMNVVAHKNLVLAKISDIIDLVNLAERLQILSIIATAIDAALFNNPILIQDMNEHSRELLAAAYKLQHKALYNDCLILCQGPWSSPRYTTIKDGKLRSLCERARLRFKRESGE